MGLLDSLGEKGGAALGLEIGQAIRAGIEHLAGNRHVFTLGSMKVKIGDITMEIEGVTVAYEIAEKQTCPSSSVPGIPGAGGDGE